MKRNGSVVLAVVALGALALLAACGGGSGVSAADKAEAEQLFKTRCSSCHGPNGEGNGPAAAGLNPKPRNYHDAQWQASTTDEEIEKAIIYGGAAVGKSPQMAANPDLQAKPGVVKALREKIRSFWN